MKIRFISFVFGYSCIKCLFPFYRVKDNMYNNIEAKVDKIRRSSNLTRLFDIS